MQRQVERRRDTVWHGEAAVAEWVVPHSRVWIKIRRDALRESDPSPRYRHQEDKSP